MKSHLTSLKHTNEKQWPENLTDQRNPSTLYSYLSPKILEVPDRLNALV